jgi:hypothetical protein
VQPTYFAAFADSSAQSPQNCGLCVEISYGGKSITATIVDDCGTCGAQTGHLDLSMPAANALGLNSSNGDPKSGVTWKAVSCQINGDIVALFNNGYAGQVYFQNVNFPVASATAGGHTGNPSYGYWDFGAVVSGQPVTLTDVLGHTAHGTIPSSSGQSIGGQFAVTCP